jgi:hypothetical protein
MSLIVLSASPAGVSHCATSFCGPILLCNCLNN